MVPGSDHRVQWSIEIDSLIAAPRHIRGGRRAQRRGGNASVVQKAVLLGDSLAMNDLGYIYDVGGRFSPSLLIANELVP
jgi:hypothetical protein